jgi:hypothetical protein
MPGKSDRFVFTKDLVFDLIPTERGIGGSLEDKPILIEFGPTALDTLTGRRLVAAVGVAESLIRLVALSHRRSERLHHHLAACSPTPHRGLLRLKGYVRVHRKARGHTRRNRLFFSATRKRQRGYQQD